MTYTLNDCKWHGKNWHAGCPACEGAEVSNPVNRTLNDCRSAYNKWLDGNSTYKDGENDCWGLWQEAWDARGACSEIPGNERQAMKKAFKNRYEFGFDTYQFPVGSHEYTGRAAFDAGHYDGWTNAVSALHHQKREIGCISPNEDKEICSPESGGNPAQNLKPVGYCNHPHPDGRPGKRVIGYIFQDNWPQIKDLMALWKLPAKFDNLYCVLKLIVERGQPDDEAVSLANQALAEIDEGKSHVA